jgi:uncharacterized protein (TIGR00375 family)
MEIIADLHLHSKYSRAVSQKMVIPEIAKWAKKKGLDLVGAPDWTHPLQLRELKRDLIKVGEGVFSYREDLNGPRFLLVTEISSIYSQNGKGRRIHTLFFAPSFSVVESINEKLLTRGVKLMSDGRPVTGLSVKELAEIAFSISKDCLVVPAHLWTPWFGTYGDKGGFNSLKEAYGDLSNQIFAIETGHSSDPAMNWRIKELDSRTILSFSDAHSLPKMSREATVFEIEDVKKLRYEDIKEAIINNKIAYTIEFYPEEGKYHYTGHRQCGVKQSPEETERLGEICPVCGRSLTIGVMHRVEELATRSVDEIQTEVVKMGEGVKGIKWNDRPAYIRLVPLMEILSEILGLGFSSQTVENKYNRLTEHFGSEFEILLKTPVEEIAKVGGEKLAEGVKKVRKGDIFIDPGYDGVFGKVKIWSDSKEEKGEKKEQMSLF